MRSIAPALSSRQFALLWSGQAVSQLGDGVFTIALAIEAIDLTHSASGLAFILVARSLPAVLLALIGGVVGDRLSRRVIMLASDVVRGLAVGAITVLVATHHAAEWQLVLLSVLFGLGDAFFQPASNAIVPEILDAEFLVSASSLSMTTQQFGASLAGPALGGVVVAAIGIAGSFAFDAGSFAVSSFCLALMAATPRRVEPNERMFEQIRKGLAYCRTQKWMWRSLGPVSIFNFAATGILGVLTPVLIRRVMHGSPLDLGLVFALGGLGGILGALGVPRWGSRRRPVTLMAGVWGLAGFSLLGLGFSPNPWWVAVFVFGAFFGITAGNVVWFPLMQTLIEPDMLGRAFSVDSVLSFALTPLGFLAAGLAGGAWGDRLSIVVLGALAATVGLMVFVPGVREPERDGLNLFERRHEDPEESPPGLATGQ